MSVTFCKFARKIFANLDYKYFMKKFKLSEKLADRTVRLYTQNNIAY